MVFLVKGVLKISNKFSYRRTLMPKCDFSKVAMQLSWNHILACVLSCKFIAYFQNTFSYEHLRMITSDKHFWSLAIPSIWDKFLRFSRARTPPLPSPLDKGHKLLVDKTLKKCSIHLLNILIIVYVQFSSCGFNRR